MSKLYKLKSWFTVPEVAQHLTRLFEEPVTPADVLQLALDEKIELSFRLVNTAYARQLRIIREGEDIEYVNVPSLNGEKKLEAIGGGAFLVHWHPDGIGMVQPASEYIHEIQGEWDLPMEGGARMCVWDAYQQLTNGEPLEWIDDNGVVFRGKHYAYQLMAQFKDEKYKEHIPENFYPVSRLPNNDPTLLGMRSESLHKFVASIVEGDKPESQQPASRSAETRTAGSLLAIIRALLHGVKLNPDDKRAVSTIQRWSESTGHELTAETIKKYLKQISDT